MRGFWPDEKVDRGNLNRASIVYKLLIQIEKLLLKRSNKIIVLTKESIDVLLKKYIFLKRCNFTIIPTCVDTNQFNLIKKKKNNKNFLTFTYLGSIYTAYDLNPILFFFSQILKINDKCKLNIFTSKLSKVNSILKNFQIAECSLVIKSVDHRNISNELNDSDLGIFFLKNNYSIKASFPTKIGELLASGLPILCNNFNDDITKIIQENNLGFIYDFNNKDVKKIYKNIFDLVNNPKTFIRCNEYANKNLSINAGISKLKNIYDEI